jgi:hypothetical protein
VTNFYTLDDNNITQDSQAVKLLMNKSRRAGRDRENLEAGEKYFKFLKKGT